MHEREKEPCGCAAVFSPLHIACASDLLARNNFTILNIVFGRQSLKTWEENSPISLKPSWESLFHGSLALQICLEPSLLIQRTCACSLGLAGGHCNRGRYYDQCLYSQQVKNVLSGCWNLPKVLLCLQSCLSYSWTEPQSTAWMNQVLSLENPKLHLCFLQMISFCWLHQPTTFSMCLGFAAEWGHGSLPGNTGLFPPQVVGDLLP